jgi:hypothetical protein
MFFDDDADYPVVKFTLADMIDNAAALEAIIERKEGLIEQLTTPHYNVSAYEQPQAQSKAKKAPVKKKAPARRSKFA